MATLPRGEQPRRRDAIRTEAPRMGQLDHDLAAGCRPSLSPELELRTLQLASAKCRWGLARGVALASCLLRDPLGPLFVDVDESLCDAADEATAALGAAT